MTRAFVLMTAMPPTKGHLHLIEFATRIGSTAEVIICTQPDEPFAEERVEAIREATKNMRVNIHRVHKTLPQEPSVAVGFWDMWHGFLRMFGLTQNDVIVASELYGKKLAEISGTKFFPYDLDRSIYFSKATDVRECPRQNFDEILPEFQKHLRMRVTIFGAESTGKTTLSRELARRMNGYWFFEYARPYLETIGTDITTESMTAIWKGQKALQDHADDLFDKPFIIQDTDLFSTVGYWDFWDMNTPEQLVEDAIVGSSDLYVITQSNIPFEQDPLRYGGDKRESDDQYWIDLCKRYNLNYVVLDAASVRGRVAEAESIIESFFDETREIKYRRRGQ